MNTEATGLLIALGGIGMCIEEAKACWIILILNNLKELHFGHTVNAIVCSYWLEINF